VSQSSQLDEKDLKRLEEAVSEKNACSSSIVSVCRRRAKLTRLFRQLCQTAFFFLQLNINTALRLVLLRFVSFFFPTFCSRNYFENNFRLNSAVFVLQTFAVKLNAVSV